MKIKIFYSIIFTFVIGFITSCSDDPNSVGSVLVPDNDKLKSTVFSTLAENVDQSFTSFQEDSLYWGSSDRLLLGNFENISSEILISFQILLPDSIKTSLESGTGIKLASSWIEMYPSYWIGDSSNYSFSAQEIGTHWNSVKIDEDSINEVRASLGPNILEDYSYSPGDTLIKFGIGNDLVDSWVKKTFDDSYPDEYGIMLRPTQSGGIAGFQALTSFPRYKYPTLFLVFENEDQIMDTVLAGPRLDIHIPSGEKLSDPINSIRLQGSISVRGRLFFNIENLPENILINSAKLDLFTDDLNTFQGSIKTDSVAVSFYHSFENDSIRYDFGKYPLIRNNEKYSGEIRQFVQRWVEGEKNEGLELKLTDENRSPAAVSFFSSTHPIESLRPLLTINYTK